MRMSRFREVFNKLKGKLFPSQANLQWKVTPITEDSWRLPPKEVTEEAMSHAILLSEPGDTIHVWGKVTFKVPLPMRGCKAIDNGEIFVTHESMHNLGEGNWHCRDCGLCRMPGTGTCVTVFQGEDEGDWD
jgi:hypothetical protein